MVTMTSGTCEAVRAWEAGRTIEAHHAAAIGSCHRRCCRRRSLPRKKACSSSLVISSGLSPPTKSIAAETR